MFHPVQSFKKILIFHEVQKIHDYIKIHGFRIQSRLTESRFFYSFSPSSFSLVRSSIYASLQSTPSSLVPEDFLHVFEFSKHPRAELGFLNFSIQFSINPYFTDSSSQLVFFNSQFYILGAWSMKWEKPVQKPENAKKGVGRQFVCGREKLVYVSLFFWHYRGITTQ